MSVNNVLKLLCIHIAAMLLVTACSESDSGSGGDGPTQQGPQSTPAPTVTPPPTATPVPTPAPITGTPGSFVVGSNLSPADTTVFYNVGCATAGQATSTMMIDPRLKVGDQFRNRVYFNDPANSLTFDTKDTTTLVSQSESDFDTVVTASTIPGITPGETSSTICTVTSDGQGSCEGSQSANISGVNIYIFANLPNVGLGNNTTIDEKGWYILDDGKGVPAWRETVHSVGGIWDPQNLSILPTTTGTQDVVTVYLTSLPSSDVDFCGGAKAVTDTIVTADDGTVLNKIGGQLLGVTLVK